MQFSITITGEDKELTPAVQALVAALAEGNAYVTVGKPNAEPEKPKRNRTAPKNEEPTKPDSEEDKSDADDQSDDDGNVEEIPTVVELRAKAQEVGTTPEAKKAIKALLDKYESASISNVPEDKRSAFMAELGKI